MKIGRTLVFIMTGMLSLLTVTCCTKSESNVEGSTESLIKSENGFPDKDISGIIQWGKGGGTDTLMRPLTKIAEKEMGVSIVLDNKTGGTGTLATQYVHDQESDRYKLLMGAENPQLYQALDILNLSYDDFEPVLIIGDETVGIAVSKDSPYKSLKDIIEASIENPGTIKLSTTGEGGLPWEVASFFMEITGATFHQIPYDSDASAKQAVLEGECDLTVCKIQSGLEDYQNGDLIFLSMLSTSPVAQLEDVPLVIDDYPEFASYLPWGPFYGVFVNKGTDQEYIDTLTKAFQKAYEDSSYQELLSSKGINGLGLSGQEAKAYLTQWRKTTLTTLVNSGAVDKSLEELNIQ